MDMVERVARAICKKQTGIRSGYETFSQNDVKLARAALAATSNYIEEIYGSLHPGVVCIRSALNAEERKTP